MTLENKSIYGDAVSKSRTTSQEVIWKENDGFSGCSLDDKVKSNNCQVPRLSPPAIVVHETLRKGTMADEKGEKPPNPAVEFTPKSGPEVSVEGEATLGKPQWYQEFLCEKSQEDNGLPPTQRVLDNYPASIARRRWQSTEDISNADEAKHVASARVPPHHEQLPSPPSFRRRGRKQSMFEIQPKSSEAEMIEIQEIRIEQGVVQAVRESATTLPDLAGTNKTLDAREISAHENHSRQQVTDTATWLPSPHGLPGTQTRDTRKPRSCPSCSNYAKEAWTSTTSDQPCSLRTRSVPRDRRRSLGFLTTPTWAVMTYRDNNADQSAPRSPRTRRSNSAVTRDSWEQNNTITNSMEEQHRRMSKPNWNKHIAIRENSLHENDQPEKTAAANGIEKTSDDEAEPTNPDEEVEEFRPRLRSRSLEDFRLAAREKVLEARERDKRKDSRRKSFEVWLSDKQHETMQKMNVLALEKRREAAEETGKRLNRKGKSYEEWLREKGRGGELARKQTEPAARGNETKNETHERQRVAQARYEKWLADKEMEALEREKSLLKKAERKTIEMRKKYEEREKLRINELNYSTGPVCG